MTAPRLPLITLLALSAAVFTSCNQDPRTPASGSLAEAYEDGFLIGVALNAQQTSGTAAEEARLALEHFNSVTPENIMKWQHLQPRPGEFQWEASDAFVSWAEANDLWIVGHTLVWHNQTPAWVFVDEDGEPLSREALIDRMRTHIHTVVERYRGRIQAWDVVNEAFNEDGTWRDSPWRQIIGDDYIDLAFQFAHEADPEAELYYNDFTLHRADKRAGAIRLIRGMQERGIPIHGVGTQEHIHLRWPEIEAIEQAIIELAELGLPVMVTELDVDVLPPAFEYEGAEVTLEAEAREELDPYAAGLPPEIAQEQAARYESIFEVYWRHRDKISRVTFWGLTDRNSWLNNWPVRGRTSYPLLFDRQGEPKPAFDAVLAIPQERD